MSCQELVQLRDNRPRWDRISQFIASTDLGWTFQSQRLGIMDASRNITKTSEHARSIEADVAIGYSFGAVVLPINTVQTGTDPEPLRYYRRWVFSKPVSFNGKVGRCSDEKSGIAKPSTQFTVSIQMSSPEDLELRYTLFLYDDRKNVLFTGEFLARPTQGQGQRQAPSGPPVANSSPLPTQSETSSNHADENTAALRVAYKSAAFLEKCDGLIVIGQPLAEVQARLTKLEKSAAAMNIDLQAAKRKALEEAKGDLDMFDMFAALGPLNYAQRSTLQQFCSVNAIALLDASKHFAELDRAAGR